MEFRRVLFRSYRRAAALRLDPVRPAAERPLAGGHRGGAFRAARLCQRTPGQDAGDAPRWVLHLRRSEEHTSELQSLMRISYAVFCLKKTQRQRKTQKKEH